MVVEKWIRADRTQGEKRVEVWQLQSEGLRPNAVSDKSGVTKETEKKLRAELHEPPGPPFEYLKKYGADELLVSYWETLWGKRPSKTKRSPLLGPLRRALCPDRVITRVLEAVKKPKQSSWRGDIHDSLLAPGENQLPWYGADRDIYINMIMAAESMEDFEPRFVELLKTYPSFEYIEVSSWLADNTMTGAARIARIKPGTLPRVPG